MKNVWLIFLIKEVSFFLFSPWLYSEIPNRVRIYKLNIGENSCMKSSNPEKKMFFINRKALTNIIFLALEYDSKFYILRIDCCPCCFNGIFCVINKTIYDEKPVYLKHSKSVEVRDNVETDAPSGVFFESSPLLVSKVFIDFKNNRSISCCQCSEYRNFREYLEDVKDDEIKKNYFKIKDVDLSVMCTLDDCENVSVDKSVSEEIYITNSMTSKDLNKLLRSSFGR